eukprot:g75242.t1
MIRVFLGPFTGITDAFLFDVFYGIPLFVELLTSLSGNDVFCATWRLSTRRNPMDVPLRQSDGKRGPWPGILGMLGLMLSAGAGWMTSQILRPRTPRERPFKPLQGIQAVLSPKGPLLGGEPAPGVPSMFQLSPSPDALSCIFSYGLIDDAIHFPEGYTVSNGTTFGTKFTAGPLAVPTGEPVDNLRGKLYCYKAGSPAISQIFSAVDHLLGYDPFRPDQGPVRRVILPVVEEDGSSRKAYCYISLLQRAPKPSDEVDFLVKRIVFAMKKAQAIILAKADDGTDSFMQALILYYTLYSALNMKGTELVLGVVVFPRVEREQDLHQPELAKDREVHAWVTLNGEIYDPTRNYDYILHKEYYRTWKEFEEKSQYKGHPTTSDEEAKRIYEKVGGLFQNIRRMQGKEQLNKLIAAGYQKELQAVMTACKPEAGELLNQAINDYGLIP